MSMNTKSILFLFYFLLFLLSPALKGQFVCGTNELTAVEKADLNAKFENVKIMNSGAFKTGKLSTLTYVPVTIHHFGNDDGSGFLDNTSINRALFGLNRDFAKMNMQFFLSSRGIISYNNSKFNTAQNTFQELHDFHAIVGDNTSVNLYISKDVKSNGTPVAGYAYIAPPIQYANLIHIATDYFNENTMVAPHEFGHYFSLLHTFEGSTNFENNELVTRNFYENAPRISANCDAAGDLICDTAADPFGSNFSVDRNGDNYIPPYNNIMSYYHSPGSILTQGQFERMSYGYQVVSSAYDFTLTNAGVGQAAPTEVKATLIDTSVNLGVRIDWKDNSESETGYFILAKKVDTAQPFKVVNAVGPNATTSNVTGLDTGSYIFRVMPSNSWQATSSDSNAVDLTTLCGNQGGNTCTAPYPGAPNYNISSVILVKDNVGIMANLGTGCSSNGYADYFNSYRATVNPGDQITMIIDTQDSNVGNWTYYAKIYVDWNQDLDFNDENELIGSDVYAQYVIPQNTPEGIYRMRFVINERSAGRDFGACYTKRGEIEDYSLKVEAKDMQPPTVLAKPYIANLEEDGTVSINPISVDNGSYDNKTPSEWLRFELSRNYFTCADIGDHNIILTVTDQAGNFSTSSTIITVKDVTPPVLDMMAEYPTLHLVGTEPATLTVDQVIHAAQDACDSQPEVLLSQTSFKSPGKFPVDVIAEDKYGNMTEVPIIVTVIDNEAPNVIVKNITVELSKNGTASITAKDLDNGTTDNNTPSDKLIFELDRTTFTCTDVGEQSVTLTVKDESGNSATGTVVVTVKDSSAPTFDILAPTLDLEGQSSVKLTQGQILSILKDNCDSAPTVTFSQTDFTAAGVYNIKITVADKYGNTAEKTTTVTVKDSYANISDLFNITVQDETCANKGNGSINIKASKDLAYSYSLNGGADTAFKNSVTIGNLKNGTYKICIKLPSGTQYCYELKVGAPANLTGKMSVSADGKVATINILEGTAPFIVTYGNKTIPVAGKGEVQVLLDGTAGEISVTSALACEGKMVEKLAVTEPGFKFYPNPVVSDMNISFGGAAFGDTMNVKIYSMGSQLVLDKDYSLNGSPVKINVSHLSQGAYLVVAKVGNQVKTVKIIKK